MLEPTIGLPIAMRSPNELDALALERCGEVLVGACLHFPVAGYWVDLDRHAHLNV